MSYPPILFIDDEQDCYNLFSLALQTSRLEKIPRLIHAYNLETAVYSMKKEKGRRGLYAIICDNHLADVIDGDEFLRVIRGYPNAEDLTADINKMKIEDITDEKVKEFIQSNFSDFSEYQRLVNYYFESGPEPIVIMVCGSPSEVNRRGIEDISIIPKSIPVQKLIRRLFS